jgi:hypothetical protein
MGRAEGRRGPQASAGSAAGRAAPGTAHAHVQLSRSPDLAGTGRTAVAARARGVRGGSRGDPGGQLERVSGGAFFGAVGPRAPDGGGRGQASAGPGGPRAGGAAGACDQPRGRASGIRLGGPVLRPGAADPAGGPARPGLRDHEFSKTPTLGPLRDRFLLFGVVVRRVPVAHADHARAVTGLSAADLARGGGLAAAWIGGSMGEASAWARGMSGGQGAAASGNRQRKSDEVTERGGGPGGCKVGCGKCRGRGQQTAHSPLDKRADDRGDRRPRRLRLPTLPTATTAAMASRFQSQSRSREPGTLGVGASGDPSPRFRPRPAGSAPRPPKPWPIFCGEALTRASTAMSSDRRLSPRARELPPAKPVARMRRVSTHLAGRAAARGRVTSGRGGGRGGGRRAP